MPILKVANVYFNQSGSSKLEYWNDNVVRFAANSLDIPSGTTLNRPTGASLDVGQIRYNTDITAFEFYTTAGWENVATQTVVTAAFNQANTGGANGNVVIRSYTSPATWTKPANFKFIKVTVVGGGGAGGGGPSGANIVGTGGSGGGTSIAFKSAPSIPGPVAVTVGAGGSAATGPGAVTGGTGGTSSFGTIASATGGGGGAWRTQGAVGTGSSGNINIPGSGGTAIIPGGVQQYYSLGGTSGLNFGGINGDTSGDAGLGYGAGGSGVIGGAASPTSPSGPGSAGIVIVEEYY